MIFPKNKMIIFAMLLAFISTSCDSKKVRSHSGVLDLSILPIGGTPPDNSMFTSTDCDASFSDCGGTDRMGVRYVFFDGALSRVVAERKEVSKKFVLPAGLKFSQDIETAAQQVTVEFGVVLIRGTLSDGRVVYASNFTIRSSAGILYSIELMSDAFGKLEEVDERTDF